MKQLFKSTTNKKIAGICGGIGEMLDVDPTLIRLGVVFLALASAVFPMVIAYIVAAIIVPDKPFN